MWTKKVGMLRPSFLKKSVTLKIDEHLKTKTERKKIQKLLLKINPADHQMPTTLLQPLALVERAQKKKQVHNLLRFLKMNRLSQILPQL